jgi:hypothetical protein
LKSAKPGGSEKGVAARPKGENGESQNQEIVAKVLFFHEY